MAEVLRSRQNSVYIMSKPIQGFREKDYGMFIDLRMQ